MNQEIQGNNQLPLLPIDFNFDMDWSLPLEGDSDLLGFLEGPNLNPNDIGQCIPSPNQQSLQSSALPSAFLEGNIGEPIWRVSSLMDQVTPLRREQYNTGCDPYRQNTYIGFDHTPIRDSITLFPSNDYIYLGSALPSFIGGELLDNEDPAREKKDIAPNADDSCENKASVPSNSREIVPLRPLESTSTRTERAKTAKPRLQCQQTGCKSTFLRRYELNRHEISVHNRNTALLCPVYGCNRAHKPFPRPDKFNEHFRKHRSSDRFLCVIEECRHGPLAQTEVESHLRGHHNIEHCRQPYLDVVLKALNLRRTPLGNGEFRMDYIDSCPLAFLGCTHRASLDSLKGHLRQHELAERSKGYTAIIATLGYWSWSGIVICPICQKRLSWYSENLWNLIQHVAAHSRQERIEYAVELSEQLSPFLNGTENDLGQKYSFDMIRGDLEEAGAISRENTLCSHANQCKS